MKEVDRTPLSSQSAGDDLPERFPAYDDLTDSEDQPAEFATGLVSLAFIWAAIRRSAWLWGTIAVCGLLAGAGMFLRLPPSYQASTSILLSSSEGLGQINDDQAIAQSRTVAALAMHKLGLQQSVSSFLSEYTVTPLTDRVLLVTVS